MKTLRNFVTNIFKRLEKQPISLGRWKIETCQNKIDLKIKYSNEDHCGTCQTENSEKVLSKQENK
jgi:RNA binding exosome subunit